MPVDMNPEPGRIVLGKGASTDFYPWFKKAGVITRVSGNRVYYTDEDTGAEKFLHVFSAVVDTEKEENTLLEFTKNAIAIQEAMVASLDIKKEEMFSRMNRSVPDHKKPQDREDGAVKRRRRVKAKL